MTDMAFAQLEDRLHRLASDHVHRKNSDFGSGVTINENRKALTDLVTKLIREEDVIISRDAASGVVQSVVNRMAGFGPIEPYLNDPTVTEIMVNGPNKVFIERNGRLEPAQAAFRDNNHILNVVDRIVAPLGRRVDELTPLVDARLPDGSRVNAIIPPLAMGSPALTIRRFAADAFTLRHLVSLETLSAEMARFLQACVRSRLNILISGGTGSGKTSTLNALARCIPAGERLVTIEDTAELQLKAQNLVAMESRPPNIEGKGEVSMRRLVKNALRMRPDRIIVGEVRGMEAFDMLQAMNTGHPGSLTTIHANSSRDAVRRLEAMVLMAGLALPQRIIRESIASTLDLLVHQERLPGGTRKITSIAEVVSWHERRPPNNDIAIHDVFSYHREGLDGEGRALGRFLISQFPPRCLDTIHRRGYSVTDQLRNEIRICDGEEI